MNFLWSDNLNNLATNYLISPAKYGGFLIRYSGTNAAAQTTTLLNMGNVILNVLNNDKVNTDVEFLSLANNLYYGSVEASSVSGGAFAFSVFVPSGAWFDPLNVYSLTKEMQATFKLDFPALTSALVASGNVQISGILINGIQRYWHNIGNFNVVAQGAGQISNTLAKANIIELYLKNPSALISNLQLSKDGISYVNNQIGNELAYSNLIHQIETAGTFYAAEFAQNKVLSTANSLQLNYIYTFTGSGTLNQYFSQIQYL